MHKHAPPCSHAADVVKLAVRVAHNHHSRALGRRHLHTCTGWANTMGSGGEAGWLQAAGMSCRCCTNAAQAASTKSWHPATATRQDVPLQAPAPPPSAIPRGAWVRPAAAGGSAPAGRTPLPGAARPSGRPVLPGRRRPALQPPRHTKRASTPPAVPAAAAPAAPSWCRGRRLLPAG